MRARLVFNLAQLRLRGAKFVSQMHAGKHSHACGIASARAISNIRHQLIDFVSHSLHFGGIAIGKQRV